MFMPKPPLLYLDERRMPNRQSLLDIKSSPEEFLEGTIAVVVREKRFNLAWVCWSRQAVTRSSVAPLFTVDGIPLQFPLITIAF